MVYGTVSPDSPDAEPRRWRLVRRLLLAWPIWLLVSLLVAVLLLPETANAGTTIVVTTTLDEIAGDGLCSLREAIIAANSDAAFYDCPAGSGNDTVTFAPGLPSPAVFLLTLTGSGENNGLTGDLDISGSASNTLTITGSGAANTIVDGNDSDRVFDILALARVTLTGITVRHGNPGSGKQGGGIVVRGTGRLTIENSVIMSNTAASGGGAHVLGLLSAADSTIELNNGGGVRNQAGLLLFTNVQVANNQGPGVSNESGGTLQFTDGAVTGNEEGGIYNDGATATVAGLKIAENTGGSGIHNRGQGNMARLTVTNSSVLSNSGTSGAGILNEGPQATATVEDTEITANVATAGGGGINNNGSFTLKHSTVSANVARSGGGIDHNGSTLAMTNVTLSGNSASDNGGGLHSRTSSTLTNVTVSGNSASGADTGANIYVDGDSAQVTFANTIVAYPGAGGNCVNNAGAVYSSGYNLDSENSCSFFAIGDLNNTDPLLGLLADNGGVTPTHLLLTGSPAIDAGDGGTCPLIDQRDLPRPRDGGSGSALCDIGAVERQPCGNATAPPIVSLSIVGSDISLSWQLGSDAVLTNLYTSADVPYISPAPLPWRVVGDTTTVHENGYSGSPRYYALTGRDECGGESSDILRAGIFPFPLVPGNQNP